MQRFTKKDASLALRGHEAGVIDQVGDMCISYVGVCIKGWVLGGGGCSASPRRTPAWR